MKRQWLAILMGMLFCYPYPAYAGWFIPENRIAWQEWEKGDYTASLKHWDHSSKGMFGRATVLMRMGHLREAERDFRQALDVAAGLNPAYIARIWYNLGNCLYAEGALEQAQEAWHQALQYHPEHAKTAHNLTVVENLLKHRRAQMKDTRAPFIPRQSGKSGKQMQGGKLEKGEKEGYGDDGGNVATMSQTQQEVNGVRDAMDVFLRHRLAEKSARTIPVRRGPPW